MHDRPLLGVARRASHTAGFRFSPYCRRPRSRPRPTICRPDCYPFSTEYFRIHFIPAVRAVEDGLPAALLCGCAKQGAAVGAATHRQLLVSSPPALPRSSAEIVDGGTLPMEAYGGAFNVTSGGLHPEDHGTSHLSVVDADRWGRRRGRGQWAGGAGCCRGPLAAARPHACTPALTRLPPVSTALLAPRLSVSMTTTINTGFGSKLISPSTGAPRRS